MGVWQRLQRGKVPSQVWRGCPRALEEDGAGRARAPRAARGSAALGATALGEATRLVGRHLALPRAKRVGQVGDDNRAAPEGEGV